MMIRRLFGALSSPQTILSLIIVLFLESGIKVTSQSTNSSSSSSNVRSYTLWDAQTIHDRIHVWSEQYPNLLVATTAQEAYGLPAAGDPDDCPFWRENEQQNRSDEANGRAGAGGGGCPNYILTIQDYSKHPVGSVSSNQLPEVLWSGAQHGNERVGPTAVMETAHLLLQAATCLSFRPSDDMDTATRQQPQACRQELRQKYGITQDDTIKWLARLVSTRRIVIVPTANALGYYQNRRTENNMDPSRDFPFDRTDTNCLQTITARTLNHVFHEHMFQLVLTFHAGMTVIAYEWGTPSWRDSISPDDVAQYQIAAAHSQIGGGVSTTTSNPFYPFGRLNDLVYPVRGGFEDWAYAGSWDTPRVTASCQPVEDDVDDSSLERDSTIYDNSTLRAITLWISTSNRKIPLQDELGDATKNPLERNTPGHVPRNIRLSLLSAELVEPYVTINSVNQLQLSEDVVPLQKDWGQSCQISRAVELGCRRRRTPENSSSPKSLLPGQLLYVNWTVGGGMWVNSTQLWYARWSDIVPQDMLDCVQQPSMKDVRSLMEPGTMISAAFGRTRFSQVESSSSLSSLSPTVFSAFIDLGWFEPSDKIVVVASARVDLGWSRQENRDRVGPPVPPQSHLVNARTNPDWYHKKANGKTLRGRLDWFSVPLTVLLSSSSKNECQEEDGPILPIVEVSQRFQCREEGELCEASVECCSGRCGTGGEVVSLAARRASNLTLPQAGICIEVDDEEEDDPPAPSSPECIKDGNPCLLSAECCTGTCEASINATAAALSRSAATRNSVISICVDKTLAPAALPTPVPAPAPTPSPASANDDDPHAPGSPECLEHGNPCLVSSECCTGTCEASYATTIARSTSTTTRSVISICVDKTLAPAVLPTPRPTTSPPTPPASDGDSVCVGFGEACIKSFDCCSGICEDTLAISRTSSRQNSLRICIDTSAVTTAPSSSSSFRPISSSPSLPPVGVKTLEPTLEETSSSCPTLLVGSRVPLLFFFLAVLLVGL